MTASVIMADGRPSPGGFRGRDASTSLAPGPDLLFIITNGVAAGRRASVLAALGMATGLAVAHWRRRSSASAILIAKAPEALTVVRIAGAAVLLYLAYTTWKGSRDPMEAQEVPRKSLRRTYVMAALTNLANPEGHPVLPGLRPPVRAEGRARLAGVTIQCCCSA